MLKVIKIPVAFLVTGIVWAILSDPVISLLFKNIDAGRLDMYRSLNDFVFVIIISVILFVEIRRQQKQLARSEEEYRNLFETNPNPMWIYEISSFKFINVNNAAIAKYGYSRNEFLNMTLYDIRPIRDHNKLTDTARQQPVGVRYSGIWEHLKANGETFNVSITSHPVTFENKKCNLVMANDITELLDKEKKLNEANQKIQKHNNVLLNINWSNSHELRKPLCSIISLVDLLSKSTDEQEKTEYLNYLGHCSAELDEVFRKNNERLEHIDI